VPVKVAGFADAPMLGCAILAAVGAGAFDDVDSAVAAMVKIDRVIEPDAGNVARYAEHIDRYARLYPTLKAWRDAR
jgi:sugar (pentulose or hexulose) kinase